MKPAPPPLPSRSPSPSPAPSEIEPSSMAPIEVAPRRAMPQEPLVTEELAAVRPTRLWPTFLIAAGASLLVGGLLTTLASRTVTKPEVAVGASMAPQAIAQQAHVPDSRKIPPPPPPEAIAMPASSVADTPASAAPPAKVPAEDKPVVASPSAPHLPRVHADPQSTHPVPVAAHASTKSDASHAKPPAKKQPVPVVASKPKAAPPAAAAAKKPTTKQAPTPKKK